MSRGRPRADNATSLVVNDEAILMGVDIGHRWTCSCGVTGEWRPRSARLAAGERSGNVQPGELLRLLQEWQAHLAEVHPGADINMSEWID